MMANGTLVRVLIHTDVTEYLNFKYRLLTCLPFFLSVHDAIYLDGKYRLLTCLQFLILVAYASWTIN